MLCRVLRTCKSGYRWLADVVDAATRSWMEGKGRERLPVETVLDQADRWLVNGQNREIMQGR